MNAGLIAGSIATMVAVLLSLPLRSPDDILFNSATVGFGGIFAGIAAGVIWAVARRRRHRHRHRYFAIAWTFGFLGATALSVLGETQLDHFLSFALPLAAVVFLVTGGLTLILGDSNRRIKWWPAAVAVILALALGIGLAGQGDQESGKLELPPPKSSSSSSPLWQMKSRL